MTKSTKTQAHLNDVQLNILLQGDILVMLRIFGIKFAALNGICLKHGL